MTEKQTGILVIGGGPAGLSAAEAASGQGKRVTVIDENPAFGGQIWRAEKSTLSPEAKVMVDALSANGVEMIPSCSFVAPLPNRRILAVSRGIAFSIGYERLVIATGARERFIPFPGWTLPGVYGAGGLQALVKSGFDISGKRIVVAGTGPLLIAVASYLKKKGGEVLMIAEHAPLRKLVRLGLRALLIRGKLSEALSLRREISGIPYLTDSLVTAAHGDGCLEAVTVRRRRKNSRIKCDLLASGFHLVANAEVAETLGCNVFLGSLEFDVNEVMETSVNSVYCAGELTGIGGLEKSLIEGRIAGLAAADAEDEARKLSRKRRSLAGFSRAMSEAFAPRRDELSTIVTDDTIICRCEDVAFGRLRECDDLRDAKLRTRAGMGDCQGRVCGPAGQALSDWALGNRARPPILPVTVGELANLETEK